MSTRLRWPTVLPNTVPTEDAIVAPTPMYTHSLTRRLLERCCVASWMLAPTAPFFLLFGEWKLALALVAAAAALFALHRRYPVEPD